MHVSIFRHSLLSRGGDKVIVEYANHLHSRGHIVTIQTNRVSTVFEVRANIKKISGGSSKIHSIAHALSQKSTDDVLIADIIAMAFFLSFRSRRQVLYLAQDYDEAYYKNTFMRLLVRLLYCYCLRLRRIPVIAVSDELGEVLRDKFKANVTVISNGIDGNVFFPDRDREYLKAKGERQVILLFARSDYRKGFDTAVLALSALKSEIEKGGLDIWTVGERLSAPFPKRDFGFVRAEVLRKIISCSDVLLYPSRHEGLPLFVLEAMACGCPVVTTDAVRFVQHGIDALQSKSEDADAMTGNLRMILKDDDCRKRIRENAFSTVKKYSLERSCNRFEAVLLKYGRS